MKDYLYVKQTNSTNQMLKSLMREFDLPEGFVVRTDFQTSGKGQGDNVWESEKGQNLLFSLLLRPHHVAIEEQFILSQIISLATRNILLKYSDNFHVKWPNDIYHGDKKIGGILIENSITGSYISSTIIGVGINVNQKVFTSDAPNPVSLRQITGKRYSRLKLLKAIVAECMKIYREMNPELIRKNYFECLYRNKGYHLFSAEGVIFEARISGINSDGKLLLEKKSGDVAEFYFKEVEFIHT